MSELLDKLASAAKKKRDLERTLEAQLREEMRQKLSEAELAVEVAAAQAFQAGNSKAQIGRAIGSKDYNTYNGYIERGLNLVGDAVEQTASGAKIEYQKGASFVVVNGVQFTILFFHGEKPMFTTDVPVWNEDYSVMNQTVADLDGVTSGNLYEEVLGVIEA
jgi:hypothetical protein